MKEENTAIRCLVVDDEMPARQAICRQIEKHCPHFQVIQTASSASEAYRLILELTPDVVFLDIQMPNESGLELLDRFENRNFYVVFCTTYHEYAVEALRRRAFDYLLKPVDEEDLKACAKKITHKLRVQDENEESVAPGGKRVELITSGQRFFVRHADILYVEASGSYSTFYLAKGKRITVSRNLKRIEEMLGDPIFCRVHNSFLVRLASVQSFSHRNGTLHLQDGKEVPIAVRKKELVRKKLVQLMIQVHEEEPIHLAAEEEMTLS
ncbi:MAG: LytTR family DNA-binding domain-containing protein [Bacteroidetes bacterium]|nr:LytTR family DNA-binding domain-containing protein [Bacteroidota bacterium]